MNSLNGVVGRNRVDRNPPQFGKLVNARPATEPAVTAVLYAPERHLRFVVNRCTVDVAHSGLHTTSDR